MLQADESGTQIALRSLLWPGYEFRHDVGTSKVCCLRIPSNTLC